MEKKTTLSTSQLIEAVIADNEQLPRKLTKEIIDNFMNHVEQGLVAGKKLRLDKIGTLEVKDRAARKGRNPQTGEEIDIPAAKKVAFRVAKNLKDRIQE